MSTINQEDLTAGAGLIVNGLQMDLIIFLQIVESLWEAELVVLTLSSELLTLKYQRIVNVGSLLLSSAQNKIFKTQLQIRKCSTKPAQNYFLSSSSYVSVSDPYSYNPLS